MQENDGDVRDGALESAYRVGPLVRGGRIVCGRWDGEGGRKREQLEHDEWSAMRLCTRIQPAGKRKVVSDVDTGERSSSVSKML